MDTFRSGIAALLPQLRVFARSLARDPHLADDLVQDTVVLALQAEAQFTPGTNLRAWLFTILRHRFCNLLRRRQLPLAGEVEGDLLEESRVTPAAQEAVIEAQAFRRAFARLGWTHREILVLVGVHGLSYEEVAAVCGCEVGTVKSRLHRARDRLKRLLLGDDEEQPATERRAAETGEAPAAADGTTPAQPPARACATVLRAARPSTRQIASPARATASSSTPVRTPMPSRRNSRSSVATLPEAP